MNFSEMTGYEFEDYISDVLEHYGFSISKTSYSHDGGIDLLATYDKPLFAGKYIIQCKNWTGTVGQPEVRDLFGVVTSERANKGILITPSDFTEQAYEFAKGKNIELVNGRTLNTIIQGISLPIISQAAKKKSKTFNYAQYNYLSDKVENEPTDPQNYLNLLSFLRSYILNKDLESIQCEKLFDKIVEANELLMQRCYKSKSEKNYRLACLYRIAEIEIIRGNLGKATSLLLDNSWYYLERWYPQYVWNPNPTTGEAELSRIYHGVMSYNLYAAYKAIGYENGCQEQLKKPIHAPSIGRPVCSPMYSPTVQGKRCVDYFSDSQAYINNMCQAHESKYQALLDGDVPELFYYVLPNPSKDRFSYEIFDGASCPIAFFIKHFYSKKDKELRDEIHEALMQHGIL